MKIAKPRKSLREFPKSERGGREGGDGKIWADDGACGEIKQGLEVESMEREVAK